MISHFGASAEVQNFTQAQCDALFAAVLVHDDIDLDATLPLPVRLDYDGEQLARCYGLCNKLWYTGVDRSHFRKLVFTIVGGNPLDDAQRVEFKHIRARYKHIHFACYTLDERHRYPRALHWITGVMGHVQDALKYGTLAEASRYAVILFALRAALSHMVDREVADFRAASGNDFRAHVQGQIRSIGTRIAIPEVTGSEFHEIRKIISRLVALFDNLKILYPSTYHQDVSRYLSTINGLMGTFHDGLVQRKMQRTLHYHRDRFAISDPIRARLETLVAGFSAGSR